MTLVSVLQVGHPPSLGQHKFSPESICLCTRVAPATNVTKDVVKQHVAKSLRGHF